MRNPTKEMGGSASIWLFIFILLSGLLIIGGSFALYHFKGGKRITIKDIEAAEKIIGLNFTRK